MEIIAIAIFFAIAVWYLYRRLIGAWKTDKPTGVQCALHEALISPRMKAIRCSKQKCETVGWAELVKPNILRVKTGD